MFSYVVPDSLIGGLIFQIKRYTMNAREFKSIFDAFRMLIFNYCNKCIRDRVEAEDITSTIFIKLWENKESLSFKDQEAERGYLILIAKRKCIDYLKGNKNRLHREEHFEFSKDEIKDSEIDTEVINYIHALIEKLPTQERTIFKLKYFEDKDVKEISQLLKLSRQTISNTLHHAITTLRKTLKNRGINHG